MTKQRPRTSTPQLDKNGTYYFVIDGGADPATGKRRQIKRRGFYTLKAAREAMVALQGSVAHDTYVPVERVTLAHYLDRWLETLPTRGTRPNTIASYRQALKRVTDRLGAVRLQALTTLQLDEVYAELLARGSAARGPLSARTVRYSATVLGHALADAERKRVIARNPAGTATVPSARPQRRDMQCWQPADLARFLDHVRDDRQYALWRLLALAGLRRSEALGLRWSDVSLDDSTLAVRQVLVIADHRLLFAEPKTSRSRRTVSLDPATVAGLRSWRARQASERLAVGASWRGDEFGGLVFTAATGEPLKPQGVGRRFDALSRAAGVPRVRLHDLRHGHASHLLAAGVNPKVVSERLGHSTVAFTLDVYAHVMPGQHADAAAAVARLVDGL